MAIRLLLLGLSMSGVLIAAGFWADGRGQTGLRVLAADVLLIAAALLFF